MFHKSHSAQPRAIISAGLAAALLLSACARTPTPGGISNPVSTPSTGPVVTPVRPGTTPAVRPTAAPPPPEPTRLPKLTLPFQPVADGISAPRVLLSNVGNNERIDPASAIELVFDRDMDKASVEAALVTQPKTEGTLTWKNARTVSFKPANALQRGSTLDLGVNQSAKDSAGQVLREPFQVRVQAQGSLEVLQTIPAANADEVQPDTIITVMFNRPVVALTTVSQNAPQPNPLRFEPAIEGQFEWLNTSVLIFKPAKPLPGGTRFVGRIDANLKDTDGIPMGGEYSWTFSSSAPKVLTVSPENNTAAATSGASSTGRVIAPNPGPGNRPTLTRVDTAVKVTFNQNIDAASAQSSFALLDARGAPVAGAFTVLSNTLTFTPSQRLQFEAQYTVQVKPGVLSASGGVAGKDDFKSQFRTYPLPEIIRTNPQDSDRNAPPYGTFQIFFSAPVDPSTIMERISFSPAISLTRVFSYYDPFSNVFNINWPAEPATDYAVEIKPGIRDPFGNMIERGRTVRFRTGNLPPQARFLVSNNIVLLPASEQARLVVLSNNVGRIDLELNKFEITDTAGDLYRSPDQPAPGRQVRKWSVSITGDANKQKRSNVSLAEGAGTLAPGMYHLRLTSPDFPAQERAWRTQVVTLIVSDLNAVMKNAADGALVWATNLKTGEPVSGLDFKLYGLRYSGGPRPELLDLGNGTTAADGVTRIANKRASNIGSLLAISQNPFVIVSEGFGSFGGAVFRSGRGFPGPVFEDDGVDANTVEGQRGFVYTERAIYRAGQKVFIKGWLRTEDDVRFSLPGSSTVNVTVNDPRGQQVLQKSVQLDALGGFDAEFALAESAPLGGYRVQFGGTNGAQFASHAFTVAAYRPPEFEVTVSTNVSGNQTVRGGTLDATIAAKYLSGGALANNPVNWNVVASRDSFNPPQLEQYSFSDEDSPWVFYRGIFPPAPGGGAPAQPIFRGTGSTDAQGNLVITLPISREIMLPGQDGDPANGTPYSGTLSYSIEGNVTGSDNQQLAGRVKVQVHPASLYAGVGVASPIAEAGKVVTANVIAVDWGGTRLNGKTLDVTFVRREWKSNYDEATNRWSSVPVDEIIETKNVNSDARGEAVLTFTPAKAGSYRVVARVRDEAGRVQQSSRYVWVTGSDFVPWFRSNENQVNLISNKARYNAGETAQILIPSPFAGEHYALVTVERGRVIKHEVIKLASNSTVYNLPIGNEHVPNVFVSVALVSPARTGRPDAQLGNIELEVVPQAQKLNVTLSTESKLVQPGQNVTYTLTVLDSAGQPVQGSFALDLVDKGILNLRPRVSEAIVKAFYGRRELAVQTANLLGILNKVVEEEPGGRGAGGATAENAVFDAKAAPAAGAPAASPAPAAARSAAPGELAREQQAEAPAVRENFADTGFWAPAVRTDANGKATVSLKLPDNLTTWVFRAVGIDNATRVGEGLQDVQATKPLLVRPVTPRFLVVGDVIELAAVVQNNTDAAAQASVTLRESKGLSLTSPISQSINVPAKGEAIVRWTALALDAPQVDLVFDARSDIGSDASKPRLSTAPNGGLKVNRYATEETVGTAGVLDKAGSRTELIVVPPNLLPRNPGEAGTLTIRTDTSLIGAVQPGLKYVEVFPYESAEALSSRFLPTVLTYALLREFGQPGEARVQTFVREQLDKIYRLQNGDGGWGWYRERESNPHTTFYVLFGLLRAKNAGFDVRQDVIERAARYAQTTLRTTADLRQPFEFNQQAYALYVLGEAGKPDAKRVDELFDKRDLLSNHAKALVILSMGKANKADPRIKTLFADLNAKVIQSATGAHWEEGTPDFWAMNSDTRTTALVLMANALYDSANPIAVNAMRWLLAERNAEGTWKSTYESSWVMIALTEWARATSDLKANYEFGASINDKEIAKARASAETNRQSSVVSRQLTELLRDQANKLVFARGEGDGRYYYTVHMRSFLPVPSVKALDRGIRVQRRYVSADCKDGAKCATITNAKVGDVVRVELSLIAPNNLSYVQLEDFIPAGAELVDTGLATTSQLASTGALNRDGQDASPFARFSYWFPWWNWYTRAELKDDRIAVFARYVSKGSYTYSYTFRVTNAGTFNVIPAYASQQYFPEVFGRSEGAAFSVTR